MGTLWSRSNSIEWDANGDRAEGALAYFYDAGTSTPRTTYEDAALTTPHDHPVVADGNGRWPAIFLQFGSYKETITTAAAAELWSTDNIPNPEPIDTTFSVDDNSLVSTGKIIVGLGNETLAGFVRLNGRSIGSAASSATERANADTVDLYTHIYNRCADAQAAVSGGRGANAAADFAANKRLTLPDYRGAGFRGFDDMGNTAASLLGSAPVVTGSTILPGSVLGANTHVLTEAQLASHTHTGTTATEGAHTHTATTGNNSVDHTHSLNGNLTGNQSVDHTHAFTFSQSGFNITAGAQNVITGIAATGLGVAVNTTGVNVGHVHDIGGTSGGASATHTHSLTTSAGSAHSHTFTSAATGSGTAHNNVARDALVTFYIRL